VFGFHAFTLPSTATSAGLSNHGPHRGGVGWVGGHCGDGKSMSGVVGEIALGLSLKRTRHTFSVGCGKSRSQELVTTAMALVGGIDHQELEVPMWTAFVV